jgi:hypothetical protein
LGGVGVVVGFGDARAAAVCQQVVVVLSDQVFTCVENAVIVRVAKLRQVFEPIELIVSVIANDPVRQAGVCIG